MLVRIEAFFRKASRHFRRDEWTARLLNLPRIHGQGTKPGLVMIQIDGLGLVQLERAIQKGNMPFLARLLKKERYAKYRHYTGLPSNTPAVQGKLFYGVNSCVPAFSFKDSQTGQVSNMFSPEAAAGVEEKLKDKGEGLLNGGSAYGNIFTGGAAEAHFCAASMGWGGLLKAANPLGIPISLLLHFPVFIRALFLILIEVVLSVIDFFRGILYGKNFIAEMGFIPLRVAVCVLLREIIAAGAKNDIARGLPVIQLNFAGYDEQAHHRGPKSSYAHWSLRGIDGAIAGVWKAARRAHSRDYDVYLYSDHGQEETISYREENGRTIHQAVNDIFKKQEKSDLWQMESSLEYPYWRAHALRSRPAKRKTMETQPSEEKKPDNAPRVVVAAMGNIGLIYPPQTLSPDEKEALAGQLVTTAKVPFVMSKNGLGQAVAWNVNGKYIFPEEADKVLDPDHPFLKDVAKDLVELCHHPDAGELLMFGSRKGPRSLTFHDEQGSHAGPGPEETSGFALLPADALSRFFGENIHTEDLRQAAIRSLKRGERGVPAAMEIDGEPVSALRIMTYNVHGCMGRDGKVSPERIARIIARHHPDVVALQELGATELSHQAEIIADVLAMTFHFHPSFLMKKGKYGNAILSRFPMRPLRVGPLPKMSGSRMLEPRGALWVEIDCAGKKIQLLNTHLSLSPREGLMQTEALLGEDWIGNPACEGPIILCGDFNALPGSKICGRIGQKLKHAQFEMNLARPLKTLPSFFPLGLVDHVFVGADLKVLSVEVPRTELEKISSDHLPLIADIQVP